MRLTRVVAGLAAAITVVLGLSLVTASTAAAEGLGVWRAYGNTNPITSSPSTWRCGSTVEIDIDNMVAQVCAIRATNGQQVQGAVIVRNNNSTLYGVSAYVNMVDTNMDWGCPPSGVAGNSWSVCFGQTFTWVVPVAASGTADFLPLPTSGTV